MYIHINWTMFKYAKTFFTFVKAFPKGMRGLGQRDGVLVHHTEQEPVLASLLAALLHPPPDCPQVVAQVEGAGGLNTRERSLAQQQTTELHIALKVVDYLVLL